MKGMKRFYLCITNGPTVKQALIAFLAGDPEVDRNIIHDLILGHSPAFRITFLKI